MKEKIRLHYLNLGPRRFVLGAVILMIILDCLSGHYLRLSWENNHFSHKMLQASLKGVDLQMGDVSAETINEISALMKQTLDFFLGLLLINNLFFYFFYLKKRLWAQNYILFYTLSAAMFSAIMIFDNNLGYGWVFFNILTIPLYLYLYFGVKLLKNETILIPEKKAR